MRDFTIDLPGGTITHTLSFDQLATVNECFDVIVFNYPELFEIVSANEFNLCSKKDGITLDILHTHCSCLPVKMIMPTCGRRWMYVHSFHAFLPCT